MKNPETLDHKSLKRDIHACADLIKDYVYRTPIMRSRLINDLAGCNISFKCENFQRMGAFKMRGASHAILRLSEEERSRGVVTHSSGNMAQALALSARMLNVPAYIVMPENAPKVKKQAVKSYGGIITECESTLDAREREAQKIVSSRGASFIHPSNDLNVIMGQGTAALELLQEADDYDFIVAPVGGGGLLAGTAIAALTVEKKIDVIGAEPAEADDAYRSLKSGKIEKNKTALTIADGLRTELGDKNFPIIYELVDDIILASENAIVDAMRLIWERMKIIIEPSCAVPLAAILENRGRFQHKKVGIILSGGNVDLDNLPFTVNKDGLQ